MSLFSDFFNRFSAVVRSIIHFILPIAESEAGQVISALLPTAMAVVTQLETSPPGTDKQKLAEQELVSQAKTLGINAALHTINLVIEMAVSKLNLALPQPTQPPQ